jgi:hypothetical protein
VTLGASAPYALLGPKAKLPPERGHILQPTTHPPALVTIHPLISCASAKRRTDTGSAKFRVRSAQGGGVSVSVNADSQP